MLNLLYRKSKLESVNETSALLSGFAIVIFIFSSIENEKQSTLFQVAIVELSIDSYIDNNQNDAVIICYAIISCLLVGIHLLALLMSMCILPELKSVIRQSENWVSNENNKPLSSLNIFIETAWIISTGIGLFLFIIELCLIFWIKVSGFSKTAAYSAIITLAIVGVPFILFAVGFYFRVARAKVRIWKDRFEAVTRHAGALGIDSLNINEPKTANNKLSSTVKQKNEVHQA